MSDVESELRDRVDSFVTQLAALIRRQALEAVEEVIKKGEMTAPVSAPKVGRPAKAAPAPAKAAPVAAAKPSKPAAKPVAVKRAPGEKRPPAELKALVERVYGYIKSNPNQGVELMAKSLSLPTKELTLPIRKLLNDKRITSQGQKRATRYSPKG
jgi:hypothetical protein